MTNDAVPQQLFSPVRMPTNFDEVQRNIRAIEDYVNAPHRTYGSRLISPLFFEEIDTSDAITIKSTGSGTFGSGLWDGVQVDLDRRFRAFVWAELELVNTDAADNYHTHFYLPVDYGGVTQDAGVAMRQWTPQASPDHRFALSNIRMVDKRLDVKTTVTFQWGVQQDSGVNQDASVRRRKMIVAIFDAPDAVANTPVVWTRFTRTRSAYRNQESNDAL